VLVGCAALLRSPTEKGPPDREPCGWTQDTPRGFTVWPRESPDKTGEIMDFELGAHYMLTMQQPGFAKEPFEAVYAGERETDGLDYHSFVGVNRAFVLGVPDDQVGVTFDIEPL
jgi:hypothetical protein